MFIYKYIYLYTHILTSPGPGPGSLSDSGVDEDIFISHTWQSSGISKTLACYAGNGYRWSVAGTSFRVQNG